MKTALTKQTVRILGPIEAWRDDRRLDLGGPRQVGLFAYLLLHPNRAVPNDVLLDALWGPVRSGADNRLHMAIARLRKSLAPLERPEQLELRTVHGGYLLSLGSNHLDADVFAGLVEGGLRAVQEDEPALASSLLSQALALWRGPPLAEVAYEDFAQGDIRRLEELRRAALETRIDAELRLGRHRELIGELGRLLAEHPTCERLSAQLMLALYRSDRQADALKVYDRTRTQLSAQLGLEPGPTLKALQAAILEHAPSLNEGGSSDSRASRGTLTHSPALSRPELVPTPDVRQARSAIDPTPDSKTRSQNSSTCTSLTSRIRLHGSSEHWYRQSWTTPPRQDAADGSEPLNEAA